MVHVEIKAYFREGLQATLNTLPLLNGDAFAWQSLSKKPQQTREIIDGHALHVLTWYTAMSGVKEGEIVRIARTYKDFILVKCPEGNSGWISKEAVEPVISSQDWTKSAT